MDSGFENRPLTAKEIEEARQITADAMKEGAVGPSVEVSYYPGGYSDTEELVGLCRVVKRYDGVSVFISV